MKQTLRALMVMSVVLVVGAITGASIAAASAQTFFRYCNKGSLGFGMKFHVVPGGGGHLTTSITYYITGIKKDKKTTIVFYNKGPSLYHKYKHSTVYALTGESVNGEIDNADSDGKWHPFDLHKLGPYPLPIGGFPNGGSRFWRSWYHYIVDIWPNGNASRGCWFQYEVDGPSTAYFP